MEKYADKPMDFADASLVTAAQVLAIQRIFTIDRNDFLTYQIASETVKVLRKVRCKLFVHENHKKHENVNL